jgi:hypothetical protein
MAVFSGNGTNSAPSFTFSSDTDTGIYRYNANVLGVTAGGVNTAAFANSGKLTLFAQGVGESVAIQSTNTVNNASSNTNYLRFYDSAGAQGYVGYAGTQATFSIAGGTSQVVNINSNTSTTFTNGGINGAKFESNGFVGGTNDGVAGSAGGNYIIRAAYAGAGTDLAGGTLSLFAGRGTGNATSAIQFYHWQQQSSGTTTQPAQLAGGFYQSGVASGNFFRLASASGGIQFNGDTAADNALDDYEQGTFTVGYSTTGTGFSSVSYNASSGYYVKVGRMVTVWIDIRTSNLTFGSATGNLIVTGFPFAPAITAAQDGVGFGICAVFSGGGTVSNNVGIVLANGSTNGWVVQRPNANSGTAVLQIPANAVTTGSFVNQNHIEVSFSYFV